MNGRKLTKEDIGKKFTLKFFDKGRYFLLLGITSKNFCVGEDRNGYADVWENGGFIEYEEPKQNKRIEAAHGFCKYSDGQVRITAHIGTYDEIKKLYGDELIQWPAQWDSEKGVWYYEFDK